MKVYSLSSCFDWEGCEIEGVFRTRHEAESKRDKLANDYLSADSYEIQEWELDEDSGS